MKIVIFGLSITSSWGNGHATTFRALARALHARGHRVVFFEKDVEWYASNRDLPEPGFCELKLYTRWTDVLPLVRRELASADVAMVGSYFPDGIAADGGDAGFKSSGAHVLRYRYSDHGRYSARSAESTDYIRADQLPAAGCVLQLHRRTDAGRVGESLRSSPRRAAVLQLRSRALSHVSAVSAICLRDELHGNVCSRPAAEAGRVSLRRCHARCRRSSSLWPGHNIHAACDWPRNVRHIVHLNPRWHPHLYSSSRLILNVTRRDMVMAGYSPSVRLFEAAACGAAIVSDNWPGLDAFFRTRTRDTAAGKRRKKSCVIFANWMSANCARSVWRRSGECLRHTPVSSAPRSSSAKWRRRGAANASSLVNSEAAALISAAHHSKAAPITCRVSRCASHRVA